MNWKLLGEMLTRGAGGAATGAAVGGSAGALAGIMSDEKDDALRKALIGAIIGAGVGGGGVAAGTAAKSFPPAELTQAMDRINAGESVAQTLAQRLTGMISGAHRDAAATTVVGSLGGGALAGMAATPLYSKEKTGEHMKKQALSPATLMRYMMKRLEPLSVLHKDKALRNPQANWFMDRVASNTGEPMASNLLAASKGNTAARHDVSEVLSRLNRRYVPGGKLSDAPEALRDSAGAVARAARNEGITAQGRNLELAQIAERAKNYRALGFDKMSEHTNRQATMTPYEQGFLDKCAQLDINPSDLAPKGVYDMLGDKKDKPEESKEVSKQAQVWQRVKDMAPLLAGGATLGTIGNYGAKKLLGEENSDTIPGRLATGAVTGGMATTGAIAADALKKDPYTFLGLLLRKNLTKGK